MRNAAVHSWLTRGRGREASVCVDPDLILHPRGRLHCGCPFFSRPYLACCVEWLLMQLPPRVVLDYVLPVPARRGECGYKMTCCMS